MSLAWLVTAVSVLNLRIRDERGATATEYSMLAGFIAIVLFAGVGLFGVALNSVFGFITTGVQSALGIP